MRLRFFQLLLASFVFSLLHIDVYGQQINQEKHFKIKDDIAREICILHPTEIDAHYKFAPGNFRNKNIPRSSENQIEITYVDECNGEVWPEEAKTAFEFAADIWEAHLDTEVPIRVEATWVDLGSNVLGSAGPTAVFSDLGVEEALQNTWYPIAQASAMTGRDLGTEFDYEFDIIVNMNCAFPDWHFPTDANPPAGTLDAVTVLLHEIGHGIGFVGSINGDPNAQVADWGLGQADLPFIYDRFTLEGRFRELLDLNIYPKPSQELYEALIGEEDGVFFSGRDAEFALNYMRVPLYSPKPFNPGSSYSHLDQEFFSNSENALMRPQLDRALAVHSPGPVFCGMLKDMGWPIAQPCEDLLPPEGFLDRPFLASPENGTFQLDISPTLMWEAVSGATEYRIQVATDFGFSDVIMDQTVNGTELDIPQMLDFNTLYFWRVQAISGGGNSKFSGIFRFTTATDPPNAVNLFTPEDGATQLFPGFELTWQAAERADDYQIQISKTSDFSDLVVDRTLSATRFAATNDFEFSTTFYWRVRGINSGGTGDWSNVRSFTTIIEKPDPVSMLISPPENENQVSVTPTLSWTGSTRASEYVIQISTDETFSSESVIEVTSSDPTLILNNPLEYATIYFWRVKATNIGGESEYNEPEQFTTVVRETAIMPNYPNPFNASTTIRFQLAESSEVTLDIFNAIGRRVAILVEGERQAGVYFENLQSAGLASGTYFIRFVADDFTEVQKMAIIK